MAPNGEASPAVLAPFLATIIGHLPLPGHHHGDKRRHTHGDSNTEVELPMTNGGSGGDGELPTAECDDGQELVVVVEEAECECCGMSEECTPGYISAVRRRFSGRWVCGLCAEAVTEEAGKNGGAQGAALAAHMGVCKRFNGFGRTHHALFQADAMRGILRKLSSGAAKSTR